MSFRRNRGSLDFFYTDIFGSLDGIGIDDPHTLDEIAGVVPLAMVAFLLEDNILGSNIFFQLEEGLIFELEDSI